MIQRQLRSYEVSVWSLQDDFITVLKAADIEHKGQIQEAELKLSVDGTQEFSFSIPMYLHNGEKLVENPTWYNYTDGIIVTNVRKIKVIINKATDDEEIFEFLITKITEKHDKNELYCEVECEGLAFQELGKIGYKISLKSDDFYDEDLKWFEAGADEAKRPKANLQYWCNKFLKPYPTEDNFIIDPHIWYYQIEMDWSSYTRYTDGELIERKTDIVYEDEYISSWYIPNDESILFPKNIEAYKEKERLVDLEESNKYNLTQDLAETFEVYCKYIYDHDENYHIIGRRIVFYNSFIEENKGPIDVNYKYNSTSISREMDSTELITKMFVRPVDCDINDSGLITIMDVSANKSKEDYLLNFDYLYKIGAIDKNLYDYVPIYEKKMYDFNVKLIEIENKIININIKIPEVEAKLTMAKNAAQLDQERINAANDLLNNLIKKSGTEDSGVLRVTADNPDTAVLLQENSNSNNNIYFINAPKEGIIHSSLSLYRTINFSASGNERLSDKIDSGKYVFDEFNNLIKITNLSIDDSGKRIIYLTYDYVPKLYYDNIKRIWATRLMNDQKNAEEKESELDTLKTELQSLEEQQQVLLLEKQKEVTYFEELMGPALREGYWQPDDYSDYGDNYVEEHQILMHNIDNNESKRSFFYWDNEVFDDEQSLYYELSVNQNKVYYPCIDLSSPSTLAAVKDHLDELSFLYYDYDAPTIAGASIERTPNMRRAMALGSGAKLAFVMINNVVKPVLLLTDIEKMTDDAINYMLSSKASPALGKLETTFDYDDEQNPIKVQETLYVNSLSWITLNDNSQIVFPRIQIDSSSLKTSDDQLGVLFNSCSLKNYSDFYLLTRSDKNTQEVTESKVKYFLTIRPETFITNLKDNSNLIKIKFTLSNADTSIYLDALQVLKDSSIPQVSYDLDIGLVQEKYIKTVYKMLNRIVHINDNELHFENVQGYISEVTLNLDVPLEDKIEIKNYKTKFEDLFSKIVASTEQMKKTEYTSTIIAQAFSPEGTINEGTLITSLAKSKMNYSFNNGQLTISENEGIWAASDSGIVSFRSDGIFTANEQDSNGNWLWRSCILPQGINADLIVAGQLDTSKIRVFSGDKIRFQLNGDGLFAYKDGNGDNGIDSKQYVVMNQDGLFLKADAGAFGEINPLVDVNRVAITWNGLTLKNYNNEETLSMDPDTGNLIITGNAIIGPWHMTNTAFYYGESSDSGEFFGQPNGMYLGQKGFSIGDIFKIYRNINANKLDYFSIEDQSTIEDFNENDENYNSKKPALVGENYLFALQRELNTVYIENTENPSAPIAKSMSSYSLKLKDITFDESIIQGIISVMPPSFYKTSEIEQDSNNNSFNPVFPKDVVNGSIGVLYTDIISQDEGDDSIIVPFSANSDWCSWNSQNNPLQTLGLKVGLANAVDYKKRTQQTYFGIYATRWNVSGTGGENSSRLGNWARAGIAGTSTNKSATLSCLNVTAGGTAGTSFTLNFKYQLRTESVYDYIPKDHIRNSGININIYSSKIDSTFGKEFELIASGTFSVPFNKGGTYIQDGYNASIPMILMTDIEATNNNDLSSNYYWVVFYSTLSYTLIYVDPATVQIGQSQVTPIVSPDLYALYIKSSGAWRKLIGSSNASNYILPKATALDLGGIKVGSGLSINNEGVLSTTIEDSIPNILMSQELTQEINALSEKASFKENLNSDWKRCFTMGVISDMHGSVTAWQNFYTEINKNKSSIDLALCLGDTTQRPKTLINNVWTDVTNFASRTDIDQDISYMYVIGNHDIWDDSCGCISTSEAYNKFIDPLSGIIVSGSHPYYYKDFNNYKIRVICLYEYEAAASTKPNNVNVDAPENEDWRQERYISIDQINWLINTLKETPENYGVIIALHQAVWATNNDNPIIDYDSLFTTNKWYYQEQTKTETNLQGLSYPLSSSNVNGDCIGDLIDSFIKRSSLNKAYSCEHSLPGYTVVADFSTVNTGVEFICYIGGHAHASFIMHLNDHPEQLQIIVPSGHISDLYQRRLDDIRPDGSDNYYYIAVNRDRKVIKLLKAGSRITGDCRERKITEISYDTTNGGT